MVEKEVKVEEVEHDHDYHDGDELEEQVVAVRVEKWPYDV